MTELSDVAARFRERLNRESDAVARRVARLWRSVDTRDIDAGWDRVAPDMDRVVRAGQARAATLGATYATRTMRAQQMTLQPDTVNTASFIGVTREGREVVPELYSAATATKRLIGGGTSVGGAFSAGTGLLSVLASNIIRDTGRGAVSTFGASQGATRTVRVVQPGACSRCAILAGATGLSAFQRHPSCRCTNMVIPGMTAPEGFYSSPSDYFESLTEAEQSRIFTNAGAEAIRLGADPIKVVNARRGATRRSTGIAGARLVRTRIGTFNGNPVYGYVTVEGTTARGAFGSGRTDLRKSGDQRYRRTATRRLMPETIFDLTSDPEMRKVLLRDAGYVNPIIRDQSNNDWLRLWRAQQAEDRAIAQRFYRSRGL